MAKSATTRLDAASAALADANRQLAELEAKRNAALLKDDDRTADRLLAEIEQQRRMARGAEDKIALLKVEAEREEATRRVRAHEGLITRVEGKLRLRDEAGREVADLVAKLEVAYRKLISLSEEIGPAWNWSTVDRNVVMTTGGAIQAQLAHEFFRLSHKPFLGGTPGLRAEVSLPGSKCSRPTAWLGFPEREPALVAVLKAASEHASKLMRSGKVAQSESLPPDISDTVPPPPASAPSAPAASGNGGETPDPAPTTDQAKLAALLKRQAQLAEDMTPEGEAAYQQVVAEIATLQ